jgi:hypothetical protein
MSKRTAAAPAISAPRVIHYIQPTPHADLIAYPAAELAARRREQRIAYARWRQRQDAIAERDRKTRRFLLGLGITLGVGILTAIGVLGWLAYRAITHAAHASHAAGAAGHGAGGGGGDVILGVLAVALLAVGVVGGHRCVTVVQHWHS